MTPVFRLLGAAAAVGLTALLVVGSALPWSLDDGTGGRIRLSWRAVGQRLEACRAPTAEELAALPAHMRQTEICDARLAPFRLQVEIDERPVHDGAVQPEGARGDRPAYVREEFAVAPGPHRLWVRFATELPPDLPPVPAQELDAVVEVAAGRILLVTRDDHGLRVVGP